MIYMCEYCFEEFDKDYECEHHEDNCEKNPIKIHSCTRCKYLATKSFKYKGKWEHNYNCMKNTNVYYNLNLTNECNEFKEK